MCRGEWDKADVNKNRRYEDGPDPDRNPAYVYGIFQMPRRGFRLVFAKNLEIWAKD